MRSRAATVRQGFLYILLIVLAILNILKWSSVVERQHIVRITKTVYAKDGILHLNVLNDQINKEAVILSLRKEGVILIEPVKLLPGESVGNVQISDIQKGSHSCLMEYETRTIEGEKSIGTIVYDILLVVE